MFLLVESVRGFHVKRWWLRFRIVGITIPKSRFSQNDSPKIDEFREFKLTLRIAPRVVKLCTANILDAHRLGLPAKSRSEVIGSALVEGAATIADLVGDADADRS